VVNNVADEGDSGARLTPPAAGSSNSDDNDGDDDLTDGDTDGWGVVADWNDGSRVVDTQGGAGSSSGSGSSGDGVSPSSGGDDDKIITDGTPSSPSPVVTETVATLPSITLSTPSWLRQRPWMGYLAGVVVLVVAVGALAYVRQPAGEQSPTYSRVQGRDEEAPGAAGSGGALSMQQVRTRSKIGSSSRLDTLAASRGVPYGSPEPDMVVELRERSAAGALLARGRPM
jgi:hypothetical protein